jgi:hypothetical protein
MFSLAFGVGTQDRNGNWLEVCYPRPVLQPAAALVAHVTQILGHADGPNSLRCSRNLPAASGRSSPRCSPPTASPHRCPRCT